jgi:biotin carboxylase
MKKKSILFCGNALSSEVFEILHKIYNIYMICEYDDDVGKKYTKKWVVANSKNPKEALSKAIELHDSGYKFDAVLSLCWDSAMSVSLIGEHFNLNVLPFSIARNSTNKIIRSTIFKENNIPAPLFEACKTKEDVENVLKRIGYPIVLKPINLSAGRGTILVENSEELEQAYNDSKKFLTENENHMKNSDNQHIILNQFIKGTEYSTEGLMIDGAFHLTGISERVFRYEESKPYFVEIGDIMPVLLSEDLKKKCFNITQKAALALEIKNGVVKGDLIVNSKGDVLVFEITPRLGGPRFGTEMIPLSNGTNILKAAIQQALGEKIDLQLLKPNKNYGMVSRNIFPAPGKITKIQGLEDIKLLPGYYDFKWLNYIPYKLNDIVESPEKLCAGVGYFIATGNNRKEAIANADRIEKKIVIEV